MTDEANKYVPLLATTPFITLAESVRAGKGSYALLLGSGVSRSSGMPTGWEIVLHLVEKVALLSGNDTMGEPETWFKER